MKRFHSLKILDPFVMGKEYASVQKAIQIMVQTILLSKVTEKQRAMLEVKNYHYWDPNLKEKGGMQGLLEHLIFDALGAVSTFRTQDHFYTEIFLHDLKKFTGISDLELFKKEVEDINHRWEVLASLKVESVTSGSPKISFQLL